MLSSTLLTLYGPPVHWRSESLWSGRFAGPRPTCAQERSAISVRVKPRTRTAYANQVLSVLEMRQTEGHGLRALRLFGQPH
jgi:hypothetical protein